MKKAVIGVTVLIALVIVVYILRYTSKTQQSKTIESPAGPVVFDMTYRGLGGSLDDLYYATNWSFGYPPPRKDETPFVKEVVEKCRKFKIVCNLYFKEAKWSVVELKDDKAVAFYFDLNEDSQFSKNEKILPVENTRSGPSDPTEFVTPDFILTTRYGYKIPFRFLLQVNYEETGLSQSSFIWNPLCVLEGTSTLSGKPTKLIFFARDFSANTFDSYGMSDFALKTDGGQIQRPASRYKLSSIINYEGQFYNLKLLGSHRPDQNIRVVLDEYTGEKGQLDVMFRHQPDLKMKLSDLSITECQDNTVNFGFSGNHFTVPTGQYKIDACFITYGKETAQQWSMSAQNLPEVVISDDKTSRVELSKPVLLITAVDKSKRITKNYKHQTVFPEETEIYFEPFIRGEAGELYRRCRYKPNDSQSYTRIQSDLRIVNAEGKQVVTTKLEYG